MFSAIADGFNYLFKQLWDVVAWVLNGIWQLLQPVFDLIGAIFYAIYKLGVVLLKILQLVLSLAKLLIGLATGLFKTIFGLSYSGSAPSPLPSSYQSVVQKIQPIFTTLQFDKVAYLLIFAIWVFGAFTAMRIIGGMRSAGSD